jgi:hypothetical protein
MNINQEDNFENTSKEEKETREFKEAEGQKEFGDRSFDIPTEKEQNEFLLIHGHAMEKMLVGIEKDGTITRTPYCNIDFLRNIDKYK